MEVYGFESCPAVPGLLAVGCADGNVYLPQQPLMVLQGHTQRVFTVKWSPIKGLLASASDDNTIRVWDVLRGVCVSILSGHAAPVRCLDWCSELPAVLVSGSWDACIRVWDIRNGNTLASLPYHTQDVYSIRSHASKPFLYLSTGRDGSVREWSLADLLLRDVRARALLQGKLDTSFVAQAQQVLTEPGNVTSLCGNASKALITDDASSPTPNNALITSSALIDAPAPSPTSSPAALAPGRDMEPLQAALIPIPALQ
jgi:WD40 repeat protein